MIISELGRITVQRNPELSKQAQKFLLEQEELGIRIFDLKERDEVLEHVYMRTCEMAGRYIACDLQLATYQAINLGQFEPDIMELENQKEALTLGLELDAYEFCKFASGKII